MNNTAKSKKYIIFVTGGVSSSLGKGIATAVIATLLKARYLNVAIMKLDPYLNIDPGTMSPFQHGEVFVTDDGAETDLDMGHYERFADEKCKGINSVTSGKVYASVLERERAGGYGGKTVQIVPHVIDEIIDRINAAYGPQDVEHSKRIDIVICEIGGTIGDIEAMPYVEAMRQASIHDSFDVLHVHLALMPYIDASGEMKTKPVQHSVRLVREIGIQPHILMCRSKYAFESDTRNKLSLFTGIKPEFIFNAQDVPDVYQLPLVWEEAGLGKALEKLLDYHPENYEHRLKKWHTWRENSKNTKHSCTRIVVAGKYTQLKDAYKSVYESLSHAANKCRKEIQVIAVDTDQSPEDVRKQLDSIRPHGVVVPGGFGARGVEGMIETVYYCIDNKVPYFGICLGMQLAVIAIARRHGMTDAVSAEFEPERSRQSGCVIDYMPGQSSLQLMTGASMRLGGYNCLLERGSHAARIYNASAIRERHRHRFEVSPEHVAVLSTFGLRFTGKSEQTGLCEIVELANHDGWFIGCQFHPEFISRPTHPHPLFVDFVKASIGQAQ